MASPPSLIWPEKIWDAEDGIPTLCEPLRCDSKTMKGHFVIGFTGAQNR
jgi:hypothetical protein